MSQTFRLLEAARSVTDEINDLLRKRGVLIHRTQLRNSSQSIAANIREGMGRNVGPDRSMFYRAARGSAEETDEHLRANFADRRLTPANYWRLHNRLITIVKMLNALSH